MEEEACAWGITSARFPRFLFFLFSYSVHSIDYLLWRALLLGCTGRFCTKYALLAVCSAADYVRAPCILGPHRPGVRVSVSGLGVDGGEGPAERQTGTRKVCYKKRTEMVCGFLSKLKRHGMKKNRSITRTLFRLVWCPQTRVLCVETSHTLTIFPLRTTTHFFLFFFCALFFFILIVPFILEILIYFHYFSFLYCSLKQTPKKDNRALRLQFRT